MYNQRCRDVYVDMQDVDLQMYIFRCGVTDVDINMWQHRSRYVDVDPSDVILDVARTQTNNNYRCGDADVEA